MVTLEQGPIADPYGSTSFVFRVLTCGEMYVGASPR